MSGGATCGASGGTSGGKSGRALCRTSGGASGGAVRCVRALGRHQGSAAHGSKRVRPLNFRTSGHAVEVARISET